MSGRSIEAPAKADVYMKLYIGDYLRDTMHLSTEEHGAYFLLLAHGWLHGGLVPADTERLRCIARVKSDAWQGVWNEIGRFYSRYDDDHLFQKRNREERLRAEKLNEERQRVGRKGGKAKANNLANRKQTPKQSPSKALANDLANDLANGVAKTYQSESESESDQIRSTTPDARGRNGAEPDRPDPPPPKWPARPTAHDLTTAFGLAWRDAYKKFWTEEAGAVAKARELLEDLIPKMPAAEAAIVFASIPKRIERFLASTDPKLVEARHPFSWFVQRFNAFGEVGPPKNDKPPDGIGHLKYYTPESQR